MRSAIRMVMIVVCSAIFAGATGLDSGGGIGNSEHYILQSGSLGGAFEGVQSKAGALMLVSGQLFVSTPERRGEDFNADGKVDFSDFLLFVQNFGRRQTDTAFDTRFDLNADGEVGFGDFLLFVNVFGT